MWYDEKLGILRPNTKVKDHLSSTVRHCLFNIFAAISVSGSHILLYPWPENGPYSGNKSLTWHGNTDAKFLNLRLILSDVCIKKTRQLSRHRDWATGWTSFELWFYFRQRQEKYIFFSESGPALRPTKVLIQWKWRTSYLELERPGREHNHSPYLVPRFRMSVSLRPPAHACRTWTWKTSHLL